MSKYIVLKDLSEGCPKGTVLEASSSGEIWYAFYVNGERGTCIGPLHLPVYIEAGRLRECVERYFVRMPGANRSILAWHFGLDGKSIEWVGTLNGLTPNTMSPISEIESDDCFEECDVTIWEAEVAKVAKKNEPKRHWYFRIKDAHYSNALMWHCGPDGKAIESINKFKGLMTSDGSVCARGLDYDFGFEECGKGDWDRAVEESKKETCCICGGMDRVREVELMKSWKLCYGCVRTVHYHTKGLESVANRARRESV